MLGAGCLRAYFARRPSPPGTSEVPCFISNLFEIKLMSAIGSQGRVGRVEPNQPPCRRQLTNRH
eukprot:scaffold430516_cov21-Prasinocladus_malaysianus.AAC.1